MVALSRRATKNSSIRAVENSNVPGCMVFFNLLVEIGKFLRNCTWQTFHTWGIQSYARVFVHGHVFWFI